MSLIITAEFQTAIIKNDISKMCQLIDKMNINSLLPHKQEIPLHLCVKYHRLEIAELLLRNGANVNVSNCQGTALHIACLNNDLDMTRLLLKFGANVNAYSTLSGQTPLLTASKFKHLEIVKILIKNGANIEQKELYEGSTALHNACYNALNCDLVKYLLSKGANVNSTNKNGLTPLLICIINSYNINTKLVKLLLQNGADPNKISKSRHLSPLLETIRRSSQHFLDSLETVQLLIDYDCKLDSTSLNISPILISIERNQDSITEKLIRHGANVNLTNKCGDTILTLLLKNKKFDIALLTAAMSKIDNYSIIQQNYQRYLYDPDHHHHENKKSIKQLRNFLFKQQPFFPRLEHLCRCIIRKTLGRFADKTIAKLKLPQTIKSYLLLKQL